MKRLSSILGFSLFVSVPLLAACGSDVSSNNSGGSGGSGGGGGGGTTPTALEACSDACHQFEVANCSGGMMADCTTTCQTYLEKVPTECDSAIAKLWLCIEQGAPTCDFEPTTCTALKEDADKCVQTYGCAPDGTCSGGQDGDGNSFCSCDSTCKNKKYATSCTVPAGGTMGTCDCRINGVSVGMCTMTNTNACGVTDDCCNTQYFKL